MDCELRFLRSIPGFQHYYATEDGRIFSEKRKEIIELKGSVSADGYQVVQLMNNNKKEKYRVHRIIALTWLSNLRNLEIVNHKDGNKLNNNVNNLEWVTHSENSKHAHMTGLVKTAKRPVCQLDKNGLLINEYASVTEAAKLIGASIGQISGVCSGKKLTCKGFVWSYKDEYDLGLKKRTNGHCKQVNKYTLDGELVTTYESITCAANSNNVSLSSISAACSGLQQTSGGYKWKIVHTIQTKKNTDPDEIEKWKTPKEFPKYRVSLEGRIYSFVTHKYIKPSRIQGQRDFVHLLNNFNKTKRIYVHRLVALTYIPNPDSYPVVNHKDGDCYNNTVENLEWCTYQENAIHAYENNLNSNKVNVVRTSPSGEKKVYDSIANAARSIGVTPGAVGYALRKGAKCKGYRLSHA